MVTYRFSGLGKCLVRQGKILGFKCLNWGLFVLALGGLKLSG